MVEESSPLLPPAEESIKAETDTALEPEPESGELTPELTSETDFVCDCKESTRSACKGLPFYREHEGQRYCVLHYPGKEKSADFKAALDRKLNNREFDFQGAWFPDEVDFRSFEFSAVADFSYATFTAYADFGDATFASVVDLVRATLSVDTYFSGFEFSTGADFSKATFGALADFSGATFSTDADFSGATFSAAVDFSGATFSAVADFTHATFSAAAGFDLSVFHARADFRSAFLNDSVRFFGRATERLLYDQTRLAGMALGKDPSLDLQHVRIEHPERIAFHTLDLRPHWFVNVDPRQFIFTDVGWEWDRISIKQEIAALEANDVSSPNRLLAIACRQLAENAEMNNRYEEASNFRYWAMDLARRSKWKGWAFLKTDWLHILYWAVSGYGERILRAFGWLLAVWLVCAFLYTRTGFVKPQASPEAKPANALSEPKSLSQPDANKPTEVASQSDSTQSKPDQIGAPMPIKRALIYSLAVMSLQKPDPKPLTGTAQTLVLLETILGPVQAALLALAIRRKFMR